MNQSDHVTSVTAIASCSYSESLTSHGLVDSLKAMDQSHQMTKYIKEYISERDIV